MLSSIILLGGLVSAFGLGAIGPNQEKQDNTQFKLENHKSVQYDDEDYQITLISDEFLNYSWENLYNLSDTLTISGGGTIAFKVSFDGGTFKNVVWYGGTNPYLRVTYADGYQSAYYDLDDTYYFVGHEGSSGPGGSVISLPTEPFTVVFDFTDYQSDYSTYKQAIELDIQANQPSNDYSPILGDIVSLLVSGITSFAGGLGAGVSALVGDIFINNGNLSVFGYMVVIFAGISLAIGLSRWVMNFLTSLGRKK